jgi:hypothetical protein
MEVIQTLRAMLYEAVTAVPDQVRNSLTDGITYQNVGTRAGTKKSRADEARDPVAQKF